MDEGNLYYNYFLLVYTLFYLKKEDSNGLNRSNHFFSRDKHLSSSLKKTLKTFYCNLENKNSFDTVNLFLIHQKKIYSFRKLQSICVESDKSPDFINTTHIIPESTRIFKFSICLRGGRDKSITEACQQMSQPCNSHIPDKIYCNTRTTY